jgi:hypothetical protein
MKKGLDITDKITISLMENTPIKINIEITDKSYINYYVAPKID